MVGSNLLINEKKIDDRITIFYFDDDATIRTFSAVISKERYLSNAIKQFITFTQEYYL